MKPLWTLALLMSLLARPSPAQTADFDSLPEGTIGPSFVENGLTFSNLDAGLGGSPNFAIEDASQTLAGRLGFTPSNTLGFLPPVPGPQASFTRVVSFEVSSGQPCDQATVSLFELGSPFGNFVALEALSASGGVVTTSVYSFLGTPGIHEAVLTVSGPTFDRVRIRGFGPTDGGAFLALVDHVVLGNGPQATPFCPGGAVCPCANNGVSGRGCASSANAAGALLVASGTTAPDTLTFDLSGTTATGTALLVQGSTNLSPPVPFGDGASCLGGTILGLYVRPAVGGTVVVPSSGDPSVSARSSVLGDPIAPGSTRWYQAHYRDPSASYCPAPAGGTFNLSNGITVVW